MSDPLTCPGCGEKMAPNAAPDITIDECPSCGGTWLDPGELNALATGLAGDIEYCAAANNVIHEDSPERDCPRCTKPMRTVSLMRHSDVILDHCESCGGFYLDRGEAEAMNEALRQISRSAGDEYRGTIRDHLVRVDRDTVYRAQFDVLGITAEPNEQQTLALRVFFKDPLELDLRIYEETLSSRLARVFKFFGAKGIQSGDEAFDRAWEVEGKPAEEVRALLTDTVRAQLMSFLEEQPHIYTQPGHLEVRDDRVIYREGPYSLDWLDVYGKGLSYDPEEDPAGLAERLINLARALHWARHTR